MKKKEEEEDPLCYKIMKV